MGICVEKRGADDGILFWHFRGQWTWGHLDEALKASHQYTGGLHKRVDFILDIRDMSLPPADLVSQLRQRARRAPDDPHTGMKIVVGADSYLKLLWQFTAPYLRPCWQIHFADTAAEAVCLIFTNRASSEKYPKISSDYSIYC